LKQVMALRRYSLAPTWVCHKN